MNYEKQTLPPFEKRRQLVKNCPCGKSNKDGKFAPYVGYENRGYCHACGEIFLPELKRNDESWRFRPKLDKLDTLKKEPSNHLHGSLIPVSAFKQSLNHHSENNFIKYLIDLFGSEITGKLISKYFIGTSKHWGSATVFWQIDIAGKIRTGKIMLYNAQTGKRIKEPYAHATWVHSLLKLPAFDLQQCFFGEHLLQGNNLPVAIVESEKTAIIASVYLPQFIWLAAGSKTGLTDQKCKVLQGRQVVLYPDLNAFDLWAKRAKELSPIARLAVSDLLERKANKNEKKLGLDLADVFINQAKRGLINQIFSNDFDSILTETHMGNDFNKIIMAKIRTKNGQVYDLVFNESGDLIHPGEQTESAQHLAAFLQKNLLPTFLDGVLCYQLVHNQ